MSGVTNLDELLRSMSPELQPEEFVFCTVKDTDYNYSGLSPVATFIEPEGLTLILTKTMAESVGLGFEGSFKQIILTVHSSLEAVGLTAAVSAKLTEYGISANVVAAYYHDHIFVPCEKATQAVAALQEFNH